LEFFSRDLASRMSLELHVELVEFLHAGFLSGLRLYGGAEFLKMDADAVERNGASAVRTLDSGHATSLMFNVSS